MAEQGIMLLEEKLQSVKARDLMTTSVATISEDTHLADLAHIMTEKRISAMPVVDTMNKVTGIITTTDLFTVMGMIRSGNVTEYGKTAVFNPTVKWAMSHDVLTVEEEATLDNIISLMLDHGIHTIPVFNKDTMVGIIGRHDVFKAFYSIVKELFT